MNKVDDVSRVFIGLNKTFNSTSPLIGSSISKWLRPWHIHLQEFSYFFFKFSFLFV